MTYLTYRDGILGTGLYDGLCDALHFRQGDTTLLAVHQNLVLLQLPHHLIDPHLIYIKNTNQPSFKQRGSCGGLLSYKDISVRNGCNNTEKNQQLDKRIVLILKRS